MSYRPIDIDRTPCMIGWRRFNGERVLVCDSACGVSGVLAGHFTRGLPPCGSCVAAAHWHWLSLNQRKKSERRAGDVNPPVTARNRAGSGAAGASQGGTGRWTSTAR
ncbi:MAG: hypothetical protein RLZZ436_189, partial [Planctomycetota bacterium]